MRVMLLCGGESAEREVSLRSGARVREALLRCGHTVDCVDFHEREVDAPFFAACRAADAVWLALHGGAGEDGRLQRMLELEGIYHYSGSGPTASALAMQKSRARTVALAQSVPIARGGLMTGTGLPQGVTYPVVLKPDEGGSSVGLFVIKNEKELKKHAPFAGVLCEEYLPGREYTVAILGRQPLPVVEIRPRGGLYDYAHKYTVGITEELCPAPISAEESRALQQMALRAFDALGLCDVARIDFKEGADGVPRFLEANTLPGMTETSLLPQAAAAVGISFDALCVRILQMAAAKRT